MKYKVGDMVFVKNICAITRTFPRYPPHSHPPSYLFNTYGIIIQTEKHSDIFLKYSTEADNGYVWFSQVNNKEYYFYENEVDGEIV